MSIFTEVINNLFCVVLFDRLLRNVDRIYNNKIFKKLKPVTSVAECRGSWVVGRGRGSWVWVWVNVVGKKIVFQKKLKLKKINSKKL